MLSREAAQAKSVIGMIAKVHRQIMFGNQLRILRTGIIALACILSWFLLSSCASLLNSPTTDIKIEVAQPSQITVYDQTFNVNERVIVTVPRSNHKLPIFIQQGNHETTHLLKPKNSQQFYANALYNCGVGLLWDWNKDKRFTYQEVLYLDLEDWSSSTLYPPFDPGRLNLSISIPYINNFQMRPENLSTRASTGFMGMSLGLEYFYTKKRFIDLRAHVVINYPMPFLGPYDPGVSERESMSTTYASITDNRMWKDNSIGYGLVFSNNNWYYSVPASTDPYEPRNSLEQWSQSVGGMGSVYHRFGNRFYLGLIYRPTLLWIQPEIRLVYEHLFSLDFRWKMKILT